MAVESHVQLCSRLGSFPPRHWAHVYTCSLQNAQVKKCTAGIFLNKIV